MLSRGVGVSNVHSPPCDHVTYPMMHLVSPNPSRPPPSFSDRMTDACENITFARYAGGKNAITADVHIMFMYRKYTQMIIYAAKKKRNLINEIYAVKLNFYYMSFLDKRR